MDETKEKLNWQRLLITIGLVVVSAGLIGGGIWYYMDQNDKAQTKSYNDTVASLQKQINELKATKTTSSTTPSTSTITTTTTDPTASWKTYTNTNPTFSFKYPTSQTATAPTAADPAVWLSTDTSRGNTTLQIVYVKTSTTTTQGYYNYIQSSTGFPSPNTVVGSKTIGGKNFYQVDINHMGIAKTNLIYENNGYGYQISYPTADASLYEQIIGTMAF